MTTIPMLRMKKLRVRQEAHKGLVYGPGLSNLKACSQAWPPICCLFLPWSHPLSLHLCLCM